MIIYRVEDPDGDGPYRGRKYRAPLRAMNDLHSDSSDHPPERQDFRAPHRDNKRHGFERPEHPAEWFAGFGDDLRAEGFVVGLYEVDETFVERGESGRQVRFDYPWGTRMGEQEIDWQ